MIIVIDYDIGNVRSVCNAFKYIGCDVKLSCDHSDIKKADGLVLPGVAAFGYATNALGQMAELVRAMATEGKPLLGICVGFQLLFEQSVEHGLHKGLGLVNGNVIPLPAGRVIPHMGWNQVTLPEDMDLFEELRPQKHFYFAHSYYADIKDTDAKIAYTDYDMQLPAAVQKENVYGVQFHPEKSGPAGLKILQNFAEICRRGKN